MAKKDKGAKVRPTEQPGEPRRITPVDIQQKEFATDRRPFQGYRESEVDRFLDEVTEELARLHAENKRLREQVELGLGPGGGLGASGGAAAEADRMVGRARQEANRLVLEARDRADLAALGPFLTREKEFLQGLASLIQRHAEGVKEDARRVRDLGDPDPAPAPGAEAVVDLTPAETPDHEATRPDPVGAPEPGPDREPEAGDDRSIRELFFGEL